MGDGPTKFLIDGIDRLGKSSLVQNILQELGYHLVIHYDKPKVLENLKITAEHLIREGVSQQYISQENVSIQNVARRLYQEEANRQMFNLLTTSLDLIIDRTHLGEMVYAPLYRGYSGDYVMKLESEFLETKPFTSQNDVRLILLTTSHFDMLTDDGLGFNWENKKKEQEMFIEAFHQSKLPNKVIVDVHNGNGGYKSFREVFTEAVYKTPKF